MAGLIVALVVLLMAGCSYTRPACDEHPFFINAGSEGDCAVQRREDAEKP